MKLWHVQMIGKNDIHSFIKQSAVWNKKSARTGVKQGSDIEANNYRRRCRDLVESQSDGFSGIEKVRIKVTQNDSDRITDLSESFESGMNEKEAEMKEYAGMENRLMSDMIQRPVKFADGAKHNLNHIEKGLQK